MIRQKNIAANIIIGLLAVSIALWFRLYPIFVHPSFDAEEKATVQVISRVREIIAKNLSTADPALINQVFNQVLKSDNQKFRDSIQTLSRQIDENEHQPSRGLLSKRHLLDPDSYYFYGLSKKLLTQGKIADHWKGSKYLNDAMLAPLGHWNPVTLHPYIGNWIYSVLKKFIPDITLMNAVSCTPLLITFLVIFPLLGLYRMIGLSSVSSLIGAIYFLLSPIYLRRSMYGWYDNDCYNIFFPVLILYFFFCVLKNKRNKTQILAAAACCVSLILYTYFWQGWVYLFSVVTLSSLLIFILCLLFYQRHLLKNSWRLLLGIFCSFLAAYIALFGFMDFISLFEEGWDAITKFLNPQLGLWPNIFISVGELNKTTLPLLLELLGGPVFLLLSVWGFIVLTTRAIKSKDPVKQAQGITLSILLSSSLVLALKAQRFNLLLLVPLGLVFPVGVEHLLTLLAKPIRLFQQPAARKEITIHCATCLCAIVLIAFPLHTAHQLAQIIRSIFNDAWESVLLKIKDETPKGSIIDTWWPPGHFITSIAERRVTFDGATINVPQAYWMANVFLSPDEEHALGILRMLNDSANQASEYLISLGMELSTAVDLLKTITVIPQNQAKEFLHAHLTNEQTEHLLGLTHSAPPPSYLFVYNDLVEKNILLSFTARWSISDIEKINRNKILLKEILNQKLPDYVNTLWEMQGGQTRFSEILTQKQKLGDMIVFDQGVSINLNNLECRIASSTFGKGTPVSLVYLNNGIITEHLYDDHNLTYSVILFQEPEGYQCILADPILARSLLIKLYYFDGAGLKAFKLFAKQSDLTGRTQIFVYQVDWTNFLKTNSN